MSSKRPSKQKPRLSVAMDVDPAAVEETRALAEGGASLEARAEPREAPERSDAAASEAPERPSRSSPRRSSRAKEEAPAPSGEDPSVQVVNGRVYVLVGDDLMPEGARVQMTIALTAMERHRWARHAEQRNMPMIDVLRERMQGIFNGEEA